jgi:hypothetical protein
VNRKFWINVFDDDCIGFERRKEMSNLEIAKRAAHMLETRDLQGLQASLADDFKAKGATLELTKPQALGYLQIFFTAFPDHRFGFTDFEDKEGMI